MCLKDMRWIFCYVWTHVRHAVTELNLLVHLQQLNRIAIGVFFEHLVVWLHPFGARWNRRPIESRHARRCCFIDHVADGGGCDDWVGKVWHANVQWAEVDELSGSDIVQARELRIDKRLTPLRRVQQELRFRLQADDICLAGGVVQLHVNAHPAHDCDRCDAPIECLKNKNFLLKNVFFRTSTVGDVGELVKFRRIDFFDLISKSLADANLTVNRTHLWCDK